MRATTAPVARSFLCVLVAIGVASSPSWSAPPGAAETRESHEGAAQVVSPRSFAEAYLVPPSADGLPEAAGCPEPSKTELWVARESLDGQPVEWQKSLILDCREPRNSRRSFPFQTHEPDVAYMQWQVSLLPFPREPSGWAAVPGLVSDGRVRVEAGQAYQWFDLDFATFGPSIADARGVFTYPHLKGMPAGSTAATIRGWSVDLVRASIEAASAGEAAAPQIDRGNPRLPKRTGPRKPPAGFGDSQKPEVVEPALGVDTLSDVSAPDIARAVPKCVPFSEVTYFVRVVALDAGEQLLGVPSDPVELRWGVPPEQPGWTVPGWALPRTAAVPTVRVESYQPIRWQDPDACYYWVVTRQNAITRICGWHVGQVLRFEPRHQKSWWEEVCDAIGSALSWIAGAVNWVSEAYDAIKSTILDALVGWTGSELLRSLADSALTGCMMAMGVPPSLPDFDDLTTMGKDYLVETLAAESPVPIPREQLEGAVDAMAASAAESQRGGANPEFFMAPDESRLYHPAVVLVRVTNDTDAPTEACYLGVRVTATNDIFDTPSPGRLPSLAPGTSFTVPIVLRENVIWSQRLSAESFLQGYGQPMGISAYPIALANPGQQVNLPQGCCGGITVMPSQPYPG